MTSSTFNSESLSASDDNDVLRRIFTADELASSNDSIEGYSFNEIFTGEFSRTQFFAHTMGMISSSPYERDGIIDLMSQALFDDIDLSGTIENSVSFNSGNFYSIDQNFCHNFGRLPVGLTQVAASLSRYESWDSSVEDLLDGLASSYQSLPHIDEKVRCYKTLKVFSTRKGFLKDIKMFQKFFSGDFKSPLFSGKSAELKLKQCLNLLYDTSLNESRYDYERWMSYFDPLMGHSKAMVDEFTNLLGKKYIKTVEGSKEHPITKFSRILDLLVQSGGFQDIDSDRMGLLAQLIMGETGVADTENLFVPTSHSSIQKNYFTSSNNAYRGILEEWSKRSLSVPGMVDGLPSADRQRYNACEKIKVGL